MKKVHSNEHFDFYISGLYTSHPIFNIKPKGSPVPSSGYYDVEYIEKMKGTRFPEKFKRSPGYWILNKQEINFELLP